MTVAAVMQPYFLAYAGYYRLMAAADVFVIFDCVQFPRRGWVHRNRFPGHDGALDFLTLPLVKAPQSASIKDLVFAPDAEQRMGDQIGRFPVLALPPPGALAETLRRDLAAPTGRVVDFLEKQMQQIATGLGFNCRFIRSSTLGLDADLKGGARVMAAARAVGAETYVNAPDGRELYTAEDFAEQGLDLKFLPPWEGPNDSLLSLLMAHPAQDIATMVRRQTRLCQ